MVFGFGWYVVFEFCEVVFECGGWVFGYVENFGVFGVFVYFGEIEVDVVGLYGYVNVVGFGGVI